MQTADPQVSDVLIVGAGPAGLMLVNILRIYGRTVTILEAHSELIDYPAGWGWMISPSAPSRP